MSKFMNRPPPPMMSAASVPNNSMFVEKLLIGLDHAPAAFDLRGQLLGSNGANLNYIRNETGANPTLRGRGSMFIDPVLGAESQEPLHLYIEHTRFDGLQNAKQLARNLVETLQQELIHFQQSNPPVSTAVQYSQQQSTSNATQVMSGTSNVSSQFVSMLAQIPPPMLAVPPPQIQTNPIMQQNIPQPQTVPIQIHRSSNMVIQQPVQNATNVSVQGNLNVPPPSITMGKPQFVSQVQLSQPPPNLQQNQQVATQIVLNQPTTAYQYIQTSNPDVQNHQQGQVTILYQPSGIVQQTTQPITHFTTQQATNVRPSQHYIVQGNTAYPCIIPPPNIQQPPPVQPIPGQQNIIFQTTTNPSNQMPLQQLQLQAPPQIVDNNPTTHINGNDPENGLSINEEKPNHDPNRSPIKSEIKSEPDKHENHENGEPLNQPINVNVPPPIQLAQTQIMATPPNSTVQHIVGNTFITSSQPQGTQTHQIYNQIPVPMQQIQATNSQAAHHQQIHVSSGQHILVNAPQYQTQTTFQPMTHNVQSFQITTQPRRPAPNEIVMVSNQTIVANPMNQSPATNLQTQPPTGVFNPHTAPPPPVVHFQQICQPQQVLQTIETSQQQIIEHPPNQFQMQQPPMQNITGNPPQSMPFIQQQRPMPQDQPRLPMKRKRGDDDNNNQPPKHMMMLPRIGMGSNNGGQQQQQQQQQQQPQPQPQPQPQFISNIQRDVQQIHSTITSTNNNMQTSNSLPIFSTSAATMTTTNNQQDEPLPVNFNNNFKLPMDGNEHFYRMPPLHMSQNNSMNNMMMNMPPRGPPRFSGNNNNNNNQGNQMHRMNFGPPPMSQMPQGQRPRYMNR